MVNEVMEFLSECPLLKNRLLNVNYLSHRTGSCSLESTEGGAVIAKYADGAQRRRERFVFAAREAFSEDKGHNIAAAELFEGIRAWLAVKNAQGDLPALPEGCTAVSLLAEQGWRRSGSGSVDARYEMQMELDYYIE